MLSEKYGRTYHYPFSPGTTSDDRINHTYWEDIREINTLVHTEKLDGENNCLSRYGVFARSHAAPTTSPWTSQLRQRWELLKNDLGDIELFGENLYAVHSIKYKRLETHFYVFAVRCLDKWLSWEEVKFYAALFDLPTVPELCTEQVNGLTAETLKQHVICLAGEPSVFGSRDALTGMDCTREGVVTRNAGEYLTADFARNVFKYVRQGHVQTDEHWTRHWKRARLVWESKQEKGGNE
ncbi:RNA ligase family protein [Bacteroides fragilis]|uniref:RNA ligase family protein n=1 Tax=Bacteroides fragilis TaxID=817 RepID=UPI002810D2C9|nr:RNA ligase family protein [Bacteroides fragilis]WMI95879.1 RNA ligase family protein [Bacteroides fragilis]